MKKAVAVFAVTVLMANAVWSQVHIMESMTISPGPVKSVSSIWDDPQCPIYPRVGGTIRIWFVRTSSSYIPDIDFHEGTTGEILLNKDILDTLILPGVRQWTKLVFWMQEPGDTSKNYPDGGYTDHILGFYDALLFDVVHQVFPDTEAEFVVGMQWAAAVSPDSSLDAIPPPEILSDVSNPFVPKDLIAPTNRHAFLIINGLNPTNPYDSLFMEIPNRKLLMTNSTVAIGDTIDLGYVACGEPLRFYLHSGKPVVANMNLYPQTSDSTVSFPGDGTEVITWPLGFDDWTDLAYDKLICSLNIVSDTTNIVVQVVPDTLSPGDTAMVILKNYQNCGMTAFDPSQSFEVGIYSGASYGTILSNDGVDTAEYFSGLQQGFKFIAADSINMDSVMVGIRVGMSQGEGVPESIVPGENPSFEKNKSHSNPTSNTQTGNSNSYWRKVPAKNLSSANKKVRSVSSTENFVYDDCGIGWVQIKKESYILKIVHHDPWSIWPDLPPEAITSNEVNPPGYNHKRGFIISVTDENGKPANQPMTVRIIHDYQQGSGGHVHGDHGTESLVPRQELQGTFYDQNGNGPFLTLTTDASGMAFVDSLVTSQISGTYLITAYLLSDPSIKDTVNLNVQIPGLVNFANWSVQSFPFYPIAFTLYQSDNGRNNHPANDYCTVAMVDNLFLATLDFYMWTASLEGGGLPTVLSLNDMSLPWGGVFDIDDDWQPSHQFHRIGHSVDINKSGTFQKYDSTHPKKPIMTALGIKLEARMKLWGGYRIPEGKSVHYEFYKAY